MYVKFVDLAPPKILRKQLDVAYDRVMSSGIYLNGEETKAFESEYSRCVRNKYCVALGSGYDGLKLALHLFRSDILVPDETIPLVYNAVNNSECNGVYYSKSNGRYDVVVKVHLYGKRDTTKLNCVHTIGDYSQAHGLLPKEDINVWSFYPTKNCGGYGNNGAITTNDYNFYKRILNYKNCDLINSKMDELQAAFLRIKLKYLKSENKKRRYIADKYVEGLGDLAWLELPDLEDSVVHQFVIRVENRDDVMEYLKINSIETMVHYSNMVNVLSLPIHSKLKDAEIEYIIDSIRRYK